MRAERRVVTVLAADVVGSTALAEQLGAEDARVILGETLAQAVTVVEAYGGTVKDLAGDGVLALFGAPVAHDDDAERAVRAALEISADVHRQAAEVERGWGLGGFAVRVGLHTGEVIVGEIGAGDRVEYGAVGDTVNTAARLQAAAPPGGVLLSSVTARLVERIADLDPPRDFELKGKTQPVQAQVVRAVRSHAAPRRGQSDVLVGRDSEWAAGREALERLTGGVGGVVWIVGEAGLGKSRLLAELKDAASSLGIGWAEGRCASYGEALPYWPVRDLLRGFFGTSVQEPDLKQRLTVRRTLETLLPKRWEESLPYLTELLGLSGEECPVSPEALQFRTFEVVGELLSAWAAERPGAVVIDDLHWADAASLALIESLLPLTETEPVLLVLAMRPETSGPAWGLHDRTRREYRHLVTDIELLPLSGREEVELIGRLCPGADLPAPLVDRLRSFAGGNPFYLEELVQSLGPEQRSLASVTVEIPETLEAVILARIDRLEPEWRAVLAAAAPLGRTFGLPLLDAVSELEHAVVRRAVHHLRRLDLLIEESRLPAPSYRFKHALIQEAVYRSLLGAERAVAHRRAAEWLTQSAGDRAESLFPLLAHHWLAAADRERAMTYARLAGDQARDNNALDEAAAHYRTLVRLLDETGRGSEAAEPLYLLGTTLCLAARFREAQEVWDRAFDLPQDPPEIVGPDVELRIGTHQLPWDVNPVHGYYATNEFLARQLYDALIEPREGPCLTPGMAERWHISPDGRTITLRLRTDLTWNDGVPIDAWQIAASVRRSMLPAAENADLPILLALERAEDWVEGRLTEADFRGVAAIDDLTLQFSLSYTAPYFPFILMYTAVGPYREDGATTGPFELTRMDGDAVEIARSKGYTRRRGGNVGRARFVPVDVGEDGPFERGAIDVGIFQPTDPSLEDRMVAGGYTMTVFLVPNAVAADVHLRRALAAATDRDVLRRGLRHTDMVATGGLVPAGLPGHTADIAVPFDADAARAHLARSTVLRPGQPIHVWTAIEAVHDWWDELMACWREVLRVPVDVTVGRMADNRSTVADHHAALWHWVAAYPDPDYFLRVLLHSESSSNAGGWRNERFDRLIAQTMAGDEGDGASQRLALFHEADRLATREECAVLPLTYRRSAALVQPGVEGWWQWGAPLQSLDRIRVRR